MALDLTGLAVNSNSTAAQQFVIGPCNTNAQTIDEMMRDANAANARMRELLDRQGPELGRQRYLQQQLPFIGCGLNGPGDYGDVMLQRAQLIEADIANKRGAAIGNPHAFDKLPEYERACKAIRPELHSGYGVSQAIAAAMRKHAPEIARNAHEYAKRLPADIGGGITIGAPGRLEREEFFTGA